MNMRILTMVLVFAVLTGCVTTPETKSTGTPTTELRIHGACENLRSSDPTVARQGIQGLFLVGGLEAYTILHLKWIAEPDPEIRNAILAGFSKLGDHRHIVDPTFPREWVLAAQRCAPSERKVRLQELNKYFPKEVKLNR
jgi:hypothetical protein